jgi:hypothetical protein
MDIDIKQVLIDEKKELQKERVQIENVNSEHYFTPSEYVEFIKKNPNSEDLIFLEMDNQRYIEYLKEFYKMARKVSWFWYELAYKRAKSKNAFVYLMGEKGNAKSSFTLIIDLIMNNTTYEDFLKYIAYDLKSLVSYTRWYKYMFLGLEETSSNTKINDKDVQNLIYEFFDRLGNTHNSYIFNAPHLRLFEYLKSDLDFTIDFYRRGRGIVWEKVQNRNINKRTTYFQRLETIRAVPLTFDIYEKYVKPKDSKNADRFDYIEKTFKALDL